MKTVLVFGTFDNLHPGHRWFLKKAAIYGNRLVAVVSRDVFVQNMKGCPPVQNEATRITELESSGLVDIAILADKNIRTYGVIKKIRPDVICLGHDQLSLLNDLESWLARSDVISPALYVLPPWKRRKFSSTKRNRVNDKAVDFLASIMLSVSIPSATTAFGRPVG